MKFILLMTTFLSFGEEEQYVLLDNLTGAQCIEELIAISEELDMDRYQPVCRQDHNAK